MEKEKEMVTPEVETVDNNVYLEQIEELKNKMDSMVDPEKYKALEEERDKLLKEYINKRPAPKAKPTPTYSKEDADNLAIKLAQAKDTTSMDYIKLSLEHREAMLAVYDKDVYGLNGEKSPETAQAAEFYKRLLEDSKSPAQFRMMLEEYLRDDPVVAQKVRAARQSRNNKK